MQANFRLKVAMIDLIDWPDAQVRSLVALGELTGCMVFADLCYLQVQLSVVGQQ